MTSNSACTGTLSTEKASWLSVMTFQLHPRRIALLLSRKLLRLLAGLLMGRAVLEWVQKHTSPSAVPDSIRCSDSPDVTTDPIRGCFPEQRSSCTHDNLVSFTLTPVSNEGKAVLIDAMDSSRSISGKRATELVAALAGAFAADSTVCLHLGNDALYPVLVLAILASNCRWTGTNTAYTSTELAHHFRISQARYVITTVEHPQTVQRAVQDSGVRAEVVVFTDLLQERPAVCTDLRTLHDLMSNQSTTTLHCRLQDIRADSVAALMQTSGTTGLPKMAARTHRSFMAELQAITDDDSHKPYEVRRLFCTPIFHAFSAPEMIFNALRLGRTSYFMRRFDDTFAQRVHDLCITETFGPPPMLLRLVNKPGEHHLLQSLRYVAYGGASLGPQLRRQFLDIFETRPRLVPVYGMTEGGWFTTLKWPEDDETSCVGRPIPGYQIRVRTTSTTLEDGQSVGEILVRGPQVMEGYLGNAEASKMAFEGDWLRTGDIGFIDQGKVYLIDRAKDMIKVNCWQVSPSELQDALLHSDDVLEAAIFGVGQEVDEHPVACVVKATPDVTAEQVKLHLRTRLASYKVSKCGIVFVESIPKSATGKILKHVLKEQVLSRPR